MKSARPAGKKTVKHLKKAGHKIRQHYWAHMPARKRHRIMLWAAFLGVSTIIGFQMAYPLDKGLPTASVAGKSQFLASHSDMAKGIVEEFDKSKLVLTLGDEKTVVSDLKSAGAEPNTEEMIARLSDYPFWQRFIPGSIVWQPAQIRDADVYFTDVILQKYAEEKAKDFSFAVEDAHLSITDGTIETIEAKPGSEVDTKALHDAIGNAAVRLGEETRIEIPAKRIPPKQTAEDLEDVRHQAELAIGHTVTITAHDQKFTPDKKEIASWLVLGADEGGVTVLSVDQERIKAYLQTINDKVGVPAGQTDIEIVNGREVGRTPGAAGQQINKDAIAAQLGGALLAAPLEVAITAQFVELPPSVIYNSKYTATQAGLQAYVNDKAWSQNMRIIIQQLDGERWHAESRATESIPSASTFKVYLAKILFDKIDAGEIRWNDPMLGTTVAGCFERMTVASTNPCAESWIAQWGRQYINNYIYGLGFSTGTSFTTGGAVQTTAADLNKYMTELYNGTILIGANRDKLLNSLGRHPYRYGVPTGSAGIVHDKVGFLWDYVHDSAIVQHPRGTYIMTVMTKGQSYGAIASVTREVERIMYP
jgi:hypothetical protein